MKNTFPLICQSNRTAVRAITSGKLLTARVQQETSSFLKTNVTILYTRKPSITFERVTTQRIKRYDTVFLYTFYPDIVCLLLANNSFFFLFTIFKYELNDFGGFLHSSLNHLTTIFRLLSFPNTFFDLFHKFKLHRSTSSNFFLDFSFDYRCYP